MATYLSDLTTDFTSHLSVRGRVVWQSAISSPMLASFGTVRVGAGSAVMPSVAFNSEASLGFYRSGNSSVAMSYGTLDLAATSIRLSMETLGVSAITNGAQMGADQFLFTLGTSGVSLVLKSGGSLWLWNSTVSAAAV